MHFELFAVAVIVHHAPQFQLVSQSFEFARVHLNESLEFARVKGLNESLEFARVALNESLETYFRAFPVSRYL